MHLNIFLVKKQHFGQTALEIPLTSFLMWRLLQFAQNVVFLLEKWNKVYREIPYKLVKMPFLPG